MVLVLFLLTLITAVNVHMMLELAEKIDALPDTKLFHSRFPCGSVPTEFVIDHPECVQWLLESMNVTSVRVARRGDRLP